MWYPQFSAYTASVALLSAAAFFRALVIAAAVSTVPDGGLAPGVATLDSQPFFWGPYSPNLYFGVRPRSPNGLSMGLLWGKIDNFAELLQNLRYTCEQHEAMAGYGWDEYDPRTGGIQSIHDVQNRLDLTTSFVKIPGGSHGGSWAARIKGELRPDAAADQKTSLFIFLAQPGDNNTLEVVRQDDDELGFDSDVTLQGSSDALGQYQVVVTRGQGTVPDSGHELSRIRTPGKALVQSLRFPDEVLWQAKPIILQQMKASVDQIAQEKLLDMDNAPPAWQVYQLENKPGLGNVHIVQKIFQGSFEFDILLSSGSRGVDMVSSDDLTNAMRSAAASFTAGFANLFAPKSPFTGEEYEKFGKSMFSNLIGGMGYFHGYSLADRSYAAEYDEEDEGFWEETEAARARKQETLEGPYELLTSVPSRPFFPRGFLWDEGFHLLPILDWDRDLAQDVIQSWYNLMDDDGWIAREQILGAEARSKVPPEFQVQYPHYANPPTLFITIEQMLDCRPPPSSASPDAADLAWLRKLYPKLQRQFSWFKKTQSGDIRSYEREAYSRREAYRWRGRSLTHCLTSGLDDYPRPQPPHPGELHVDLMSWVGMMAKILSRIATELDLLDDADEYRSVLNAIMHNLDDLHWSAQDSCYCDATIDTFEEHQLICHKGYVSLFPFLVGLLPPDHPRLGAVLALLGDETELFSPHGIRSLSLKHELYGTAENYWRSPVWININYLAVVQLHNIATQGGPHQRTARDLYVRLRHNIVSTVYNSWADTGFAWEQYDPATGKGQRTQHFTGWTSLVVKIMAMEDLSRVDGAEGGEAGSHVRDEL